MESPRPASTDPVAIRPVGGADLPFVLATWLRELRDADASPLPDDLWYPAHREALMRVLSRREVVAVVATPQGESEDILGYAVGEPGEVLHWVHVRSEFRGKRAGLVPRLLRAVGAEGSPGVPAAWRVPSGRSLRNPPRPRRFRRCYAGSASG